jgi:hypothetical protein
MPSYGRTNDNPPDLEKLFNLNFEDIDKVDTFGLTNSLVEYTVDLVANCTE